MQPDRWKTIEETFHAALQRPVHERLKYLDEVCAGDADLRREVESLLNESSQLDGFMENPANEVSLTSLAPSSLEGRVLNHYHIGPLVGSGGMADIYRARDTRLERDVAIKVVRHAQFMDKHRLNRMYREARVLATLNHTNIGSIYGIEEADGLCGLVLEFIEGETLSERIRRSVLSPEETMRIALQIAAGLEAAHGKGIIHRDLKPANIKLPPGGAVKIVDFGIAKLLRAPNLPAVATEISRQGLIVGTVAYMSPEQARGKEIDERTDIWAFGCVLYEMLSGKPPFHGDTPTDIVIKIATEDPDWSRIPRLAGASQELHRVIRKCLEKDAERRYQSIREIVTDLQAIQQDRTTAARPALSLPADDDFVLPGRFAPALFLFTQIGYMALYGAAMVYVEAIADVLERDFNVPWRSALIGTMVLAMCGLAVRVYLITAVGWRHPAAGRKFMLLFPALLALDGIWAASPLLLWRRIGYGLALTGVAMLAYVPFAQRTLIRSIYAKRSVVADRT